VRVEEFEDFVVDVGELDLDLGAVVADDDKVVLLLLSRGNDVPRGVVCADHVLVGDGEEVALVHG